MLNLIQNQTLRKLMVSAIASSTVFGASSATTAAMPMAFSRALGLRSALTFSTGFSTKPFSSSSSLFPFSSSPSLRVSCSSLLHSPFAAICHEVLQCKRQSMRFKVTRSGDAGYSPLSSNSNWSDRPPTEMAPLFPGCDYEHWLIVMDPLNDGKATKEEMIDHYIKTLAKVLGSEDAAKKSIYNVSCERYYGFGCQIDEETSTKLEGLPGVCFVLPDSYVDVENKDYGAELLVDGKIVERSPERQRRVTPQPMRNNSDRPRYNDRTRYVRRRENQSQGR